MRRIMFAATALAALAVATAAFAASGAFNTYTGSTLGFKRNKAGSVSSPAPISVIDNYVAGGTGGNRTAPLTDILTKIYGLRFDTKEFPTCSFNTIKNAKSDASCPKGSMVATGTLTASIGPQITPTVAAGTGCSVLLDVFNGGHGKLAFFFRTNATHVCFNGALTTGSVGPYQGTLSMRASGSSSTCRSRRTSRPDPRADRVAAARAPDVLQADEEGQRQDRRVPVVGRLQARQASVHRGVHRDELRRRRRQHDDRRRAPPALR